MTIKEVIMYYEKLFAPGSAALIEDGTELHGTPIFVTRKITGCCAVRTSKGRAFYIQVDKELNDGCTVIPPNQIFGIYNGGNSMNITRLKRYIEDFSNLRGDEKTMLISDAKIRLWEAYK